eukprot:s187_g27.t1
MAQPALWARFLLASALLLTLALQGCGFGSSSDDGTTSKYGDGSSSSSSSSDSSSGGWTCKRKGRRLEASPGPKTPPVKHRRLGSDALQYDERLEDPETGGFQHLKQYDVDIANDVKVVSLDTLQNVSRIRCTGSRLEMTFKEDASAAAFGVQLAPLTEGKRLFLTAESIKECARPVFLGQIQAVNALAGGYEIQYSDASYQDIFRRANVSFATSLADGFSYQPPTLEEEERTKRQEETDDGSSGRALFPSNPLASMWKSVKKFADSVTTLVDVATTVFEAVVTGEHDQEEEKWDDTFLSMDCTGNIKSTATSGSASATGTVKLDATAKLKGELRYSFSIVDWNLQEASVSVTGILEAGAVATGTGTMTFSKEVHVSTFRVRNIKILLGSIPVLMDLEAPIKVGLEANYQGNIKVTKNMVGDLTFAYKFKKDGSTNEQGEREDLHERSLTPSLKATSKTEMKSNAVVTAYTKLAPTIVLYKLFSVSVALRPYHLVKIKKVSKKTFPNVYSKQWPLKHSDAECPASRRLQNLGLRVLATTSLGRTWSGKIKFIPCSYGAEPAFQSGDIELQEVEESDTFMGVVNLSPALWGSRSVGGCSTTVKFIRTSTRGDRLEPDTGDESFFAKCDGLTFDDMSFLLSDGIGDSISGYSDCHELNLQVLEPIADNSDLPA